MRSHAINSMRSVGYVGDFYLFRAEGTPEYMLHLRIAAEEHNICIANPSESGRKTKNKILSRFFALYECAAVSG